MDRGVGLGVSGEAPQIPQQQPLAPEEKVITFKQMSGYQKRMMDDLGLDFQKSEKLVLTLEDKSNYVVHYNNLQLYLRQGMRLKKVHW